MTQSLLGMSEEQVEKIALVRARGRQILEGIDLDHVYTTEGLVEVFEDALARARLECSLDHGLAPPRAKPSRPRGWGWLKGLF